MREAKEAQLNQAHAAVERAATAGLRHKVAVHSPV